MSETAAEQLARVRFEAEQRRRMEEPMTRGDVLFALDVLRDHPLLARETVLARLVRATIEDFADEMRKRWGIHA